MIDKYVNLVCFLIEMFYFFLVFFNVLEIEVIVEGLVNELSIMFLLYLSLI